ncbi:uncharacterized protein LOC113279153 [Papaver somniferum]|uniref:uncharacterized protein LOC113279153 n=1 Tax=Papaver somniferum TaxID=3469 RepID=UPI000E6F77DB|nr:uncharacterized protein LOC113279153 [Papaver somniferum]
MKTRVWNFEFVRELNAAKRIDLLEIKHDLRNVNLSQDEEDIIEGEYTAKALYNKLIEPEEDWELADVAVSKYAPPKVTFLMWAAMHKAVPTRWMLHHRGVTVNSLLCLFCDRQVETQDHLFLHCSWAKTIWDFFISAVQMKWVLHAELTRCLQSWNLQGVPKKLKIV